LYLIRPNPTTRGLQFRSLKDDEKILPGDIIEDLSTGKRTKVNLHTFYGFLRGQKPSQARQLPDINDVLRQQF
jgi:hypothetical protein